MIVLALALVQAVPPDMLAAADQANGAYVQCLFVTSREAHAADLSFAAFERRLESICISEEQAVVSATAAVLRRRGEANAGSAARLLTLEARRTVLDTYRKALELRR